MQNQTNLVKTAINIFIVAAIMISLFQEARNFSKPPATVLNQNGEPVPNEVSTPSQDSLNGTRVDGIVIRVTDNLSPKIKQILIKHEYNVDIQSYEFQGGEWWLNAFLNYGHVLIVYFLMNKYQTETDGGMKTKIMIVGVLLTIGWFLGTPYIKPQRIALQVNGRITYERDTIIQSDIVERINQFDDLNAFQMDAAEQAHQRTPKPASSRQNFVEEEVIIEEESIEF